jgi:putative membrane-bound dehydrogenase-like protein
VSRGAVCAGASARGTVVLFHSDWRWLCFSTALGRREFSARTHIQLRLHSMKRALLLAAASAVLVQAAEPNNPADLPPPQDIVKYAGLPPEDAAKDATVPEGFTLKLFAGEPDVRQPIAFTLDDRGRIWVAEAYTYPRRAPEGQGKDRILIFEDTDGDGKFDKRTVFIEGLNLVSGMEVGFGGVWIGAAPYLMFIPDRDGDDKPDSAPEIVLDGWAYPDTHETLNTFTWGPDGWLYGCHGVFTQSKVGPPGSPDSERTRLNAGIFRYHPLKNKFELFSEGTSNPWGIDFDAHGQCWIEACVIPHLFHMIQGARYERQAGQHFNLNIYEDIKTVADHLHYAGNKGPHAANGRSDSAGGGHAHAGMMVYLGGSFPEKYTGALIMNNIHGQRLNMDVPERKGSGFVGHHAPDFVNFNDSWSQVLNMLYDQDGSVYMIDWYDKNQCHHNNEAGHDRSNGRIFKLVYNDQKFTPIDLKKKSSLELVQMLGEKNEFYARHARRILEERGKDPAVLDALKQMLKNSSDDVNQLHALWTLHVTGGLDESYALSLLKNQHEYVRAWTVQLLCEDKGPSDAALEQFAKLAADDPSPVVRLYLASAMQRTAPAKRWEVVTNLFKHGEDTDDHNLPVVYWCAAEGSIAADPNRGVKLLTETKIPKLRQFIARRITSSSKLVASK